MFVTVKWTLLIFMTHHFCHSVILGKVSKLRTPCGQCCTLWHMSGGFSHFWKHTIVHVILKFIILYGVYCEYNNSKKDTINKINCFICSLSDFCCSFVVALPYSSVTRCWPLWDFPRTMSPFLVTMTHCAEYIFQPPHGNKLTHLVYHFIIFVLYSETSSHSDPSACLWHL